MRGQTVIITGASSGLGRLTALYLAQAGANVVLAARSAEELDLLAQEVRALNVQALPIATDVTRDADVERLVAQSLDHFGRIDVLLNNAGYGIFEALEDADFRHIEGMLGVNYLGAIRCTQAVLPVMRRQNSGHIVSIASVAGLVSTPRMAAYSASKFALTAAMEALQVELLGTPIRCSIICPGPINTPFFQRANYQAMTRLGRAFGMLDPDDVAQKIAHTVAHPKMLRVIPWGFFPLVVLARAFPTLSRRVIKWLD